MAKLEGDKFLINNFCVYLHLFRVFYKIMI